MQVVKAALTLLNIVIEIRSLAVVADDAQISATERKVSILLVAADIRALTEMLAPSPSRCRLVARDCTARASPMQTGGSTIEQPSPPPGYDSSADAPVRPCRG